MELLEARTEMCKLMSRHKLEDWGFRFNNRRSSLGVCRYGKQRLELSKPFVECNSLKVMRETMLHEIAHALVGPQAGHGPKWKYTARTIGYQGGTTARGQEGLVCPPVLVRYV